MTGSHRRGPWSQTEDNTLMTLVQNQGPLNWVRISGQLGTRTPKQCRERYHQNLKPTLNHDPITPEEGELIERLVRELGKRWAEIARRLHGRSDNAVKNWWNGSQNRRKRMDKRKVSSVYGGERPEMPHYHHPHLDAIPRTFHQTPSQRALPPPPLSLMPRSLVNSNNINGHYPVEAPLSSPPLYSPNSEHAYSTSPRTQGCHHHSPGPVELPPLKNYPLSPNDNRLPSLSKLNSSNDSANKLPPLTALNPEFHKHSHHDHAAPPQDYFGPKPRFHPQLPTAPNSPESPNNGLTLRPIKDERHDISAIIHR